MKSSKDNTKSSLTHLEQKSATARRRVQKHFYKPSMTKQAHKDECDVNKILAKYRKTGVLAHLKNNPGHYDYAPDTDFQGALELVNKANEQFNKLPGSIRQTFANNPAHFVEFVSNPNNEAEMIEMGLIPKKALRREGDDQTTTKTDDSPVFQEPTDD